MRYQTSYIRGNARETYHEVYGLPNSSDVHVPCPFPTKGTCRRTKSKSSVWVACLCFTLMKPQIERQSLSMVIYKTTLLYWFFSCLFRCWLLQGKCYQIRHSEWMSVRFRSGYCLGTEKPYSYSWQYYILRGPNPSNKRMKDVTKPMNGRKWETKHCGVQFVNPNVHTKYIHTNQYTRRQSIRCNSTYTRACVYKILHTDTYTYT